MKIEILKVGNLECNCYLLEINNKILVIDPGDDFDKISEIIGDREVVGIIITHYHFDHVGALNEMVSKYDVRVNDDNNMVEEVNIIGDFVFEIIKTPGHKEDCITIYFREENVMFCGDFIFRNSIGRCDLPGGDIREMISSINKIKKYDRDIILYPGHGERTTIGYEMDNNMYFLDVNNI